MRRILTTSLVMVTVLALAGATASNGQTKGQQLGGPPPHPATGRPGQPNKGKQRPLPPAPVHRVETVQSIVNHHAPPMVTNNKPHGGGHPGKTAGSASISLKGQTKSSASSASSSSSSSSTVINNNNNENIRINIGGWGDFGSGWGGWPIWAQPVLLTGNLWGVWGVPAVWTWGLWSPIHTPYVFDP